MHVHPNVRAEDNKNRVPLMKKSSLSQIQMQTKIATIAAYAGLLINKSKTKDETENRGGKPQGPHDILSRYLCYNTTLLLF